MAQSTGVSFELERIALEGDELVVSGFWAGVRGMRFVRPTLLAGERRILATLEHKPWAPSEDALWTAAFPWTGGGKVDAGSLAIAVAPKVIVPLGQDEDDAPVPAAKPIAKPAAAPAPVAKPAAQQVPTPAAKPVAKPVAAPAPAPAAKPVAAPAPAPAAKPVAAPAPAPAAKQPAATPAATPAENPKPAAAPASASNGATAPSRPVIPVDRHQDELARARAAAERERDNALAQLAEAVEAREAAVRTRARMELAAEEAVQAREAADAALAKAEAERRDANAQRDEVLIAYRALQRQLQTERAQADRAAKGEDEDPDGENEPLGVRTVPAVRGVMAELQYPRRESKLRLSQVDLWVIRVLGIAAAGCFLLLLLSILRVFL